MAVDLKTVARRELDAFGGEPRVVRYERDAGGHWVDLLSCADRPDEGITSWATIGMSQFDTFLVTDRDVPLRVELVAACSSAVTEFGAMLSTCAFNVATGEYSISPGTIYPRVVEMYRPEVRMKHLMFVPVFLWEGFDLIETGAETIDFLQAVPVSDAEFEFAREHGADELQSLFEKAQIDVYDLDRPSVVDEPDPGFDPWASSTGS